ncbi:MAG: radical SAM protein, partial [Saprospiraceae bacterium]
MKKTVFALTPAFTQLNTPYPATTYIKGFLNTKNISCFQADLGIETILEIYSKKGFREIFDFIGEPKSPISENARRIISLKDDYLNTIDAVISFLQGRNPTMVHLICQPGFLPRASRFDQLETYFGKTFGASKKTQDEAKHLATLYIEDISDLIKECVDPFFGFSRYAERLARSANSFDEIYQNLNKAHSYIDRIQTQLLDKKLNQIQPKLVAISVPFPGNVFSAFRCAQWVKKYYPEIRVAMGGGFANTELRSLSDPRVFEFFDFISLDDGELPIECIINFVEKQYQRPIQHSDPLKRTFALVDGQVTYINNESPKDYPQSSLGTPDYSDLLLDKYISVIEVVNPMHRLWSDGQWNKLTIAHGCYWGKCTFCDITLDYIKVYEPLEASLLCDRMEEMIKQTGQNGFHFVDEAAPPAKMRDLALEIVRRKLTVSWWTNIRFEKSFNRDLCKLLKASGCIAVSGGLEVASDRLLALIQKGVTVSQVAQVCQHFTRAGIMVHAYLMYGFPSQTVQETIDSLEMVRQLFKAKIIQSGYWHQFAMTVHSPVGISPGSYKTKITNSAIGSFANNDLEFIDATGTDHDAFSEGLKKSILNFMHEIGIDYKLQDWFDFKIPRTKVNPDYILKVLQQNDTSEVNINSRIIWIGDQPQVERTFIDGTELIGLLFYDKSKTFSIKLEKGQGEWLVEILKIVSISNKELITFKQFREMYESVDKNFDTFWKSRQINLLRKNGLLL